MPEGVFYEDESGAVRTGFQRHAEDILRETKELMAAIHGDDKKTSLQAVDKLIEVVPYQAKLRVVRSQFLQMMAKGPDDKKVFQAIKELEDAITIEPDCIAARMELCGLMYTIGDVELAQTQLDKVSQYLNSMKSIVDSFKEKIDTDGALPMVDWGQILEGMD
jgi:predicted translin family RNA/ssDNA-binding protein